MLLAHHLPLKTKRLVLRNFTPEDITQAENIVRLMHAQKELNPDYFLWSAFDFKGEKPRDELFKQKAETFIARGLETLNLDYRYRLAVCSPSGRGGEIIGYVGFSYDKTVKENPPSDLGYFISPKHEGKGYALEAVSAVLFYYFLKNEELYATVAPENYPSAGLIKKIGGEYKGKTPESVSRGERAIFILRRSDFIRSLSRPEFEKYLNPAKSKVR